MGVFNTDCQATGLPITSGLACHLIFVAQGRDGSFVPVALPIEGDYDAYGRIEHILEDWNAERILEVFKGLRRKKRLTTMARGSGLPKVTSLETLIASVSTGQINQTWVQADGASLGFVLVLSDFYEGIIRAASAFHQAKATGGELPALAASPIFEALYASLDSDQWMRSSAELTLFQDWMEQHGHWEPPDGGSQHSIAEIEEELERAEKELGDWPELRLAFRRYKRDLIDLLEDEDDEVVLDKSGGKAARQKHKEVRAWLDGRHRARRQEWDTEDMASLPGLPAPPRSLASPDVMLGNRRGDAASLEQAIERIPPGGCIGVRTGTIGQSEKVETDKPFQLVGQGAYQSILLFDDAYDDCLVLEGRGPWQISGVALLANFRDDKTLCGDVVQCGKGATLAASHCLFGGGRAAFDEDGDTRGGVGVRAYSGARVELRRVHLAFNHWGAAVHDAHSKLTLRHCYNCGSEFGLFCGGKAQAFADECFFELCLHGIKTYGDEAIIEAERCRFVNQQWATAYAEQGRLRLSDCLIMGSGGHGVVCEQAGSVDASGCQITHGCRSGFWIDGPCQLAGNECLWQDEHGIVVDVHGSGRVEGNRCRRNSGFGIVRESPTSRVKLQGNDTRGNGRQGEYTFGSLARSLAQGFPEGATPPDALIRLAGYAEEKGSLLGDSLCLQPGPLVGWPGIEQEFAVFGAGPDGSLFAFWLHAGQDVTKTPVVFLDSEGAGSYVLANSFEQFLAIYARGYYDLSIVDVEPDYDDEDDLDAFRQWLREELGIKPARGVKSHLKAAKRAHPGLEAALRSS